MPSAVAGGTWTGTITINGVINEDKTEDGSSGDVGSTYYETYTKHDVTQTNVTDTFNITANDPEDLTFGISSVNFGARPLTRTTLERHVTTNEQAKLGAAATEGGRH